MNEFARKLALAGPVAALALLVGALTVSDATATPPGTLDQHLTGDPGCGTGDLHGSVGTIGTLRQEFVPTMPVLEAVDVCVHVFNNEDTWVDIIVRTGERDTQGALIAADSREAPVFNEGWVRAEFDPVAVTPGEKLVIEVSGYFGWRATCPQAGGSCPAPDGDLYPPGVSDYENADFLFRTFGSAGSAPGPGPLPSRFYWGDVDCTGYPTINDVIFLLALAASMTPPEFGADPDCPDVGDDVTVYDAGRKWGDINCIEDGRLRDAWELLRDIAFTSPGFPRNVPCPLWNLTVNVYD